MTFNGVPHSAICPVRLPQKCKSELTSSPACGQSLASPTPLIRLGECLRALKPEKESTAVKRHVVVLMIVQA